MKRLLLLPFLLWLTYGCTEKPTQTFIRSVMLTTPTPSGAESIKNFSGVVQESHNIGLGFKTAGQIEKIYVKEGDYVKKSQLIAQLDRTDYQLGVQALEIQCKQLEDEVKRTEALYRSKSISINDYEKAQAGLQQLKVQLQVNRNKLAYTRLYAPTNGYIQSVNFAPSEMVDAGTPVINLLDMHSMEVETELPTEVYQLRARFQRITCELPSTKGEDIPMKILSITPKADGNQLYQLKLTFQKENDSQLSAGMNVNVRIHIAGTDSLRTSFTLPLHTLIQSQEETYIWVMNADSTVNKRKVHCSGIDEKGRAIITAGLKGDEQIIKAGVNALQENEKVRIIHTDNKTNVGGLI